MMERAQSPDGYLNTYFTVADPQGKLKNLRDMHEMCKFTSDLLVFVYINLTRTRLLRTFDRSGARSPSV
jgi:DUF1680 family protein